MANRIIFDLDDLRKSAGELQYCSDELKRLKTRLDRAVLLLRTEGWRGKAEKVFEQQVTDLVEKLMRQYADLIETFSDILTNKVVKQYADLVEEARALKFDA